MKPQPTNPELDHRGAEIEGYTVYGISDGLHFYNSEDYRLEPYVKTGVLVEYPHFFDSGRDLFLVKKTGDYGEPFKPSTKIEQALEILDEAVKKEMIDSWQLTGSNISGERTFLAWDMGGNLIAEVKCFSSDCARQLMLTLMEMKKNGK